MVKLGVISLQGFPEKWDNTPISLIIQHSRRQNSDYRWIIDKIDRYVYIEIIEDKGLERQREREAESNWTDRKTDTQTKTFMRKVI